MIVKMIQDLWKRMEAKIEKMQEMFTKDLQELKNKQTEMNNALEGIHSRITEAEARINDLEPLFEGNPVGEGTTPRGTATPVHRPQRPAVKYFLRSFVSLFSFWDPYNVNVRAFNVPEVS